MPFNSMRIFGEVCPADWHKGERGMLETQEGVASYISQKARIYRFNLQGIQFKGYLFLFLYPNAFKMLKRFRKFIAENHLAAKGDRILLAVSGGIDSMVMAHLFLQSGYDCALHTATLPSGARNRIRMKSMCRSLPPDIKSSSFQSGLKRRAMRMKKGYQFRWQPGN